MSEDILSSFDQGILNKPIKSTDVVEARCGVCGCISHRPWSEHKRSCKAQAKYVSRYHCRGCLQRSVGFRSSVKSPSGEAWAAECKRRSIEYLRTLTDNRKSEIRRRSAEAVRSPSVRAKLSDIMKAKFSDQKYITKIKAARSRYWEDSEYRAARVLSIDQFIYRSRLVHGDKYDYSLVRFDGAARDSMVDIICPEHGIFTQRPLWHYIYGNGCPKCVNIVSTPHQELIDFITSVYGGRLVINDHDAIGFELDILLPDIKFAIEYHGDWFHSHDDVRHLSKYLHHIKATKCYNVGITLLQINEYNWKNDIKKHILESIIINRLGKSSKIAARLCKISELDEDSYRMFLDNNHLYGYKHATVKYGLYYNNELVACMSFQSHIDKWEVARLATRTGLSIIGGASKMFKHFVRSYMPAYIYTYADRALSHGVVYERLGFTRVGITKPGYRYFKNNRVFARQKFQKHKLAAKLETYDDSLTEFENMFRNGYRVIWDAGHVRYEWKNILK